MENKTEGMELLFDVLEESMGFLFEKTKESYFNLFFLTCENILAGEVVTNLSDSDKEELNKIYEPIREKDMSVEDIRKALQATILRGLKETNKNNGSMTPDTIGILMAYLISKFETKPKNHVKILDPIAGTGNLLFTIENHLDLECETYAIDNDKLCIEIIRHYKEMLQSDLIIYYEDTLKSNLRGIDYIVGDFDYYDVDSNGAYFPYETILHHVDTIKDKGVMIFLIPDDFFKYDINQEFKKKLMETSSIIGVLELPDDMFQGKAKSILILKKEIIKDKKCLMVKLPSFSDYNKFNVTLSQIEEWFLNNIYNKSEEN